MSTPDAKPTLILHLDVNKTLIFTDVAAGHSLEGLINSTLASRTFGTIDYSTQPPTWLPNDGPEPISATTSTNGISTPLISYDGFVQEFLYPYLNTQVKEDGSSLSAAEKDEIVKINTQLRAKRIALTTTFTDTGRSGEFFRDEYTKIYNELQLSSEDLNACRAVPELDFYKHLETRFLLPSYFHLLTTLIEQHRKFLILFRTFGKDVVNVITEHNLFVQGRHPLYSLPVNNPEFQQALKSLWVHLPYGTATMIRQGIAHSTDSKLVTIIGTDYQDRKENTLSRTHEYKQPHVGTIVGYRDIYNYFLSTLPSSPIATPYGSGAVMGISDDYTAWFTNAQKGHAGKLMPLDVNDTKIHSIFFDDNCGDDHDAFVTTGHNLKEYGTSSCMDPRIIDPRNVTNSRSLTWPEIRNIFAILMDPYSAVIDKEYFVKAIAVCEQNRAVQHSTV